MILGMILSGMVCFGQGKVVFDATSVYIGSRKANAGAQEVTYVFTNRSDSPIQITGIQAGEGCRSLGNSRGPVAPGKRGFISFLFTPPVKVGRYISTSVVYFNGDLKKGTELFISGEILPPEKTLADDYPYLSGDLRFKTPTLDLGAFLNTAKVERSFPVMNAAAIPVKYYISASQMHTDAYLMPDILHPGETGSLHIVYNADKKTGYGPVTDTLRLLPDKEGMAPVEVVLEMNLQEDFSRLNTAQVNEAPKVYFTLTNHEFGAVKAGSQVSHTFFIKNSGKRQLFIRNVVSSSPQLDYEMETNRVRFRQEVPIKVIYNALDKSGPFMETLTLICNDPKRPEINVYVQGAVIP